MATGRTLQKWLRCYIDGYNFTGLTRSFGPWTWAFDTPDLTAPWGDAVTGTLPNLVDINMGTYNAVLSATTDDTGTDYLKAGNGLRHIMCPVGIRADPAIGDWVWCGEFLQSSFLADASSGALMINMAFGGEYAGQCTYPQPWGKLVQNYADIVVTSTNATHVDGGGETTQGGYMIYQVFAGGTGAFTIGIEDSANDTDFLPLSGATVSIADCSVPQAGIVELSHTATVRQYLRRTATEDSAGDIVCAIAFVRGRF